MQPADDYAAAKKQVTITMLTNFTKRAHGGMFRQALSSVFEHLKDRRLYVKEVIVVDEWYDGRQACASALHLLLLAQCEDQTKRLHTGRQPLRLFPNMAFGLLLVWVGLAAMSSRAAASRSEPVGASSFSLEDYVRSGNLHEGLESWMEIFQSFGRGERMDPQVLQEMTETAGTFEGADESSASASQRSSSGVDQDLTKELAKPSVRERVQDFASNPELLTKVIQENSLVQQLAAMNPAAAQVINSPEALQKIFSKDILDVLEQGQRPDDAALESILESSQA
ncbi:pntA [Symbiodinium sp. CCMP2456]|nr:pntA [Symbiodinium sp. CCMP2456]